jgi:agmatine deiminase
MLWPERPDKWRLDAAPAQAAYAAVARAIARFTSVRIGVAPHRCDAVSAQFADQPQITCVAMASNDAWMRDVGPTVLWSTREQQWVGADWIFNAWGGALGGLYSPWDDDDAVAAAVCQHQGIRALRAPFVLEGGAIHVDGEGTLLTTEECLLNPNRNPQLSRAQIEQNLRDWLGVQTIIWLPKGVVDDETDGHVDNMACFLRPGLVALAWCDDPADPQYARSRAAEAVLFAAHDAQGRALEVVRLPVPGPLFMRAEEAAGIALDDNGMARSSGQRLAASYVNFLITNGAIILPSFDDPMDAVAQARLAAACPEYTIVPVPAREILLGGGNIHCITQQIPA